MSKHEAMIDYLKQAPMFADIACQFGRASDGAVIFNIVDGDAVISEDVIGNKTKHYDFAIVTYRAYNNDPYSSLNTEVLETVDRLMDWIDEQNKIKNYPRFDGAIVKSIKNLQNAPGIAGYDEKASLAKYMYQVRIVYTTKE